MSGPGRATSGSRVGGSAEPTAPRTEEVADRVFAYIQPNGGWWVSNAGFVKGPSQVFAIDSCSTERRTRALLEAIEQTAGQFPRTLLNTHHHGDHTNGNCLFANTAIVGHARCREALLETGITRPTGIFEPVDWGELSLAPPFVTFDERLDVYVDDLLVELSHFGTAAHTTNDVVAWLPDRRVLFSGDLVFNGATPFVLMGSVSGSLLALDRILEYDAQVIVPGHGEVCTSAALDIAGEYLRFCQTTAENAKNTGVGPLEAALEIDLHAEGFGHLTEPERLVGNLHRAFAECEGVRPGAPIDLAGAFKDMIAYNGDKPLGCLA
jgi:cyclase